MLKRLLLSHLFLIPFVSVKAQVTIKITSVPVVTPLTDTLYAAGTFNNWNPKDGNFAFQKINNQYELAIPAGSGEGKFKVTRGSWATVEGNASGNFIPDRSFTYQTNKELFIQVAGWEDFKSVGNSTALPQVRTLSITYPYTGIARRIWVYLPQDYQVQPQKKYPVMYLFDGQNIFDQATSFSGEWGVDETLVARENTGKSTAIIVAINHGDSRRMDEYSPFVNPTYGGGNGEQTEDFLINYVKPLIDSTYRVETERAYTGIGGSSLGALISLYIGIKHQSVFSKLMLFSPAIWFNRDSILAFITNEKINLPCKVSFVAGINESSTMSSDINSLSLRMQSNQSGGLIINNNLKQDGAHSEWFWRREFGEAFGWLYEELSSGLTKNSGNISTRATYYPNPTNGIIHLKESFERVEIYDLKGRLLNTFLTNENQSQLDLSSIESGTYYIRFTNKDNITTVGTIIISKP